MLIEDMELSLFPLVAGLVLLAVSGEALLRGAVTSALILRVPPLIIGLTIIALGTSAPELTVSVQAALVGQTDIAIGNVIGSNIANILLVMGTMAVLSPFVVSEASVSRDGRFMLLVSALLVGLAYYGVISLFIGTLLLAVLVIYTVYLYRSSSDAAHSAEAASSAEENALPGGLWVAIPALLIGLVGIVWGADLMVMGATQLARDFGISEAVIALSIVAIGTSLPELAVAIIASLRGQAGLAVGNIIGSNISNILLILGGTSLVAPLPIVGELAQRDVWVMLGVAVLGVCFMASKRRMSRLEGAVCVALYVGYIGLIFAV